MLGCVLGCSIAACGGGNEKEREGGGSPAPVDLSACTSRELPYLFDAAYSEALGRIVGVTGGLDIALFDPYTLDDVRIPFTVTLDMIGGGASLSLSPDGLSAAVSIDQRISIVDLVGQRETASIVTTTDSGDVVLGGNGFAYVFPRNGQSVDVHSVELATGVDHDIDTNGLATSSTLAKLYPGGSWLYGIEGGSSGHDLVRFDIREGVAHGPAHTDYNFVESYKRCGDIWLSDDGKEIYDGCATVFGANPGSPPDDGAYLGEFESIPNSQPVEEDFRSMAFARDRDRVYAVPGAQYITSETPALAASFAKFSYASRRLLEVVPLPCVAVDSRKVPLDSRYVFAPHGASQILVLGTNFVSGIWGLAIFDGP